MMTWLRGFWKSLFKRRSKHEVEPRIWQAERAASDRGIRPTSRVDGLRYGSTSIHEEARRTQDSERPTSIGEAETVDAAKEIAKVAFTGVSGAGLEPVPETIPQPEDRAGLATASSLFERKRAEAHIQVGLDFGTSCTKVVYRQHGKPFARALGFRNGLPNYPDYCLPSLAAADQGKVLLGEQAARCLLNEPWDSGLQRFKVIVAAEHSAAFRDEITQNKFNQYLEVHGLETSLSADRLTAIYLAYVMKKVRTLLKTRPEYDDVDLDLAFNICLPIEQIENREIVHGFEKILAWAQALETIWSRSSDEFDPIAGSRLVESQAGLLDPRVFLIPESVAEVASYLVSLRKRPGLHGVIDLGAGTTDVSIFNLVFMDGEAHTYWFGARNIPRGTVNVERIIAARTENSGCSCTCANMYDRLKALADGCDSTLKADIERELRNLRESHDYRRTWSSAYRLYGGGESTFEDVEIFLSGGGASLPSVRNIFAVPWWEELRVTYPVSELPIPDDYDSGETAAPFQRMAVAYGLSIPKPQLDKYVPPSEIKPFACRPMKVLDLDHEDLWAK